MSSDITGNHDVAPGRPSMAVSEYDIFRDLISPPDETATQKESRLAAEASAKKISDEIDEGLKRERLEQQKARSRCVRVLLLGQSESGKSTLQRQFTLLHAPQTFDAERTSWRLVIFLNVVRSIQRILKVLNAGVDKDDDLDEPFHTTNGSTALAPIPPGASQAKAPAAYVQEMSLRLSPITSMEEAIIAKLIGPEERGLQVSANSRQVVSGSGLAGVLEGSDREFFVRSHASWRGKNKLIDKLRRGVETIKGGESRTSLDLVDSVPTVDFDDKTDPGRIFHLCKDDLTGLWQDPWVRSRLLQMRVRLEEGPGFFLNDLDRIASGRYLPTDDDILRARIKTIGVSEYIFPVDIKGVEWRLYDVGGARTQRHAWIPYFENNVDSIIFLAPLSPFDTALAEDRKVNCLEDSLSIWKELCGNKLLARTPLVLFLNKSDLLRKKIEDGVQVSRYVVSYGDRPNTYESVERYFKNKFESTKRQFSPPDRQVFTHVTSCINQHTTRSIINNVQDILMRENLKNSALM